MTTRTTKKKVAKKKVAKKVVRKGRDHRNRVPTAEDRELAKRSHLSPPWGEDVELTPEMFNQNFGQRKFKNPDEILTLAHAYSERCFDKRVGMTVTGMALALGFNSLDAFYAYERENKELGPVVRRVRTIVEESYEQRLHGTTPTGAIFALKCMGWKEGPVQMELSGRNGAPIATINSNMTAKEAQELYAATLRPDE